MVNQKSQELIYFKAPIFVVDLAIHLCTLFFMLRALPVAPPEFEYLKTNDLGLYAMLAVSFSLSISVIGLRLHERKINVLLVVWRAILQTLLTYVLFTFMVAVVYKSVPRHMIGCCLIITTTIIALVHFLANRGIRMIRMHGHNVKKVAIVGSDVVALRLYKELLYGHATTGYKVLGFFSSLEDISLPEGAKLLGSAEAFLPWVDEHDVDEVYCSIPPAFHTDFVNQIIKKCNDNFIDFYYVPTMDGYPHRQMTFHNIGRVTIINLRDEPMNSPMAKFIKRSFDLLVSSVFLCTVYPFIFLFVWIGDLVTGSRGPVYFRQARTGYNGQSFRIYKFRSMKVNDQADTLQATENDPRKTKFGDFLRRSSIDEIPQLINVFLGDMSLIGPRPHMEHHTEVYSELISNYMVRHLAKPGITGWAQVNGCRGETKTVDEMKNRVEHDIWYIEHWSPLLDVEIFFKTLWQILPGHDKQAY